MTGRRFVLFLARSGIIALAVGLSFAGCSRQAEGERCDLKAAGRTDCEDGLACIACVQLRSGIVDRCCPSKPGAESDARCQRADTERPAEVCGDLATGGTSGSGGSTGTGGASTIGGSGGASGGTGGSGGQGGSSGTSGEGGAPDTAGAGGVQ